MAAESGYDLPSIPPSSIFDRFRGFLPKIAASPRFRSWAARFPLTRPVSRRQTQTLFDLCAGFVYSQILDAFVDSGALDALSKRPHSIDELASLTGLSPDRADRLMRAAAALTLARRCSGDRYALGLNGAALVDNPGVLAMIRHHRDLYQDLADPMALLRGDIEMTEMQRCWGYLADDRSDSLSTAKAAEYSELMALSQTMIAEIVTASFNFKPYRTIMDVGGGTGVFLSYLADVAPDAELTLFDLPQVMPAARKNIETADLSDRIKTTGGDFATGDLPAPVDLITLVRVTFDHSDDTVLALLKACRKALSANGALMIAEPLSGSPKPDRTADAYFGFYLLAMGPGRTRRFDEHSDLLKRAGFGAIEQVRSIQPSLARIILARP